jgi:hypothetical protein
VRTRVASSYRFSAINRSARDRDSSRCPAAYPGVPRVRRKKKNIHSGKTRKKRQLLSIIFGHTYYNIGSIETTLIIILDAVFSKSGILKSLDARKKTRKNPPDIIVVILGVRDEDLRRPWADPDPPVPFPCPSPGF